MNNPFEGHAAASYLDGPPRQVPGYDSLLRMVTLLLAEKVPEDGHILVLGAGGGLEIRAMADSQQRWRFEGVDPSQDMLDLAAQTSEMFADRVRLQPGYIDFASDGPFDGATCILTMHFVPREERLETLRQVRKRLKPNAPFLVAHISFPQEEPERTLWIERHVAWAGTAPENVDAAIHAISTRLHILSPYEEEALLIEAGFTQVRLFYAGLSFRGWVCYAG